MTAQHRSPSRPRPWRRGAALLTGGLALALAATGAATAANAAPVKAAPAVAQPAAVSKVTPAQVTGCSLNFGGGYVSTTITDGDGSGYDNLTITQHNGLPRRIHFGWNSVSDRVGGRWRGISTLAAGETQTWVAVGVYVDAGAAWSGSASDQRGNSGWNTCYFR